MRTKNIDLRRDRKVHTAHSQLHVAKIGDIYRWGTTHIPAYINNAQDYTIELQILANKWIRAKNIIQKQKRENINAEETKAIDDFKSFTERWNMAKTIEIITTKGPPQTAQELRGLRYKDFENLAKVLLSYETHYYGTRK